MLGFQRTLLWKYNWQMGQKRLKSLRPWTNRTELTLARPRNVFPCSIFWRKWMECKRECFYCVSPPLKQSYSKSHLNRNTKGRKQWTIKYMNIWNNFARQAQIRWGPSARHKVVFSFWLQQWKEIRGIAKSWLHHCSKILSLSHSRNQSFKRSFRRWDSSS